MSELFSQLKMKKCILYFLSLLIISGCSYMGDYEKSGIEYGKEIFTADYDALMSNDKLSLYDNKTFYITISDYKGNGEYLLKGDTLILNYYNENDFFHKAYLLKGENGWIDPLIKTKGYWTIDTLRDCGLMTYKNELKN